MKKYDSILLGNGFNCAVSNELNSRNDNSYGYLFYLKTFLNKLYEHETKGYEDEYVKIAEAILNRSCGIQFKNIYERLLRYHKKDEPIELICNIESNLVELAKSFFQNTVHDFEERVLAAAVAGAGMTIYEISKKYTFFGKKNLSKSKMKKVESYMERFDELLFEIYTLYNVHDVILNFYISKHPEFELVRKKYYLGFIRKHLKEKAIIMTTNYGNEIKEYFPRVEYLHGRFVDYKELLSECGKIERKLNIKRPDGQYRFFFASTAVKKHYVTEAGIYDDRFFSDTNREYGNMLIFGMSFARINGVIEGFYDRTRDFDMHIDMHIVKRIDELFSKPSRVDTVTIVAYSELDAQLYRKFLNSFGANNQTNISKLYNDGKIKIISEKELSLGKLKYVIYKVKSSIIK